MRYRRGRTTIARLTAAMGRSVSVVGIAAPSEYELSEVVVTAERQGAESVQKIAFAINSGDLERVGHAGLEDYTGVVPSVSLQFTGPGQDKIDIPGDSVTLARPRTIGLRARIGF